ncbi:hypothetical protein NTD82_05560 [Pseudomonas sp. 5P_5.1_Bac1]|nr:hypothetical protein [Pseudomonas sp. 5P_5.1_Bac1]MCU1720758.1 hypothetical protein [Pseudomonas sp. 5P_5.1_Bac1]
MHSFASYLHPICILSAVKLHPFGASRVTAGDEAYLVAGGRLDLLAAEDSDYSLYDKMRKGKRKGDRFIFS